MVLSAPPNRIRILSIDAFDAKTKERVSKEITDLKDPYQAQNRLCMPGGDYAVKWPYAMHTTSFALLVYRGVEVMLFYKRQISTLDQLPLDTTAAIKLGTDDQAWIPVNLFTASYSGVFERFQTQILSYEQQLIQKNQIILQLQSQVNEFAAISDDAKAKLRDKTFIKKAQQENSKPKVTEAIVASASEVINDFLQRIRPFTLQEYIRKWYLYAYFVIGEMPDLPKKIDPDKKNRLLKKLDKMVKKAKRNREMDQPYKPMLMKPKANKPEKKKKVEPPSKKKIKPARPTQSVGKKKLKIKTRRRA